MLTKIQKKLVWKKILQKEDCRVGKLNEDPIHPKGINHALIYAMLLKKDLIFLAKILSQTESKIYFFL